MRGIVYTGQRKTASLPLVWAETLVLMIIPQIEAKTFLFLSYSKMKPLTNKLNYMS